MERVFTIIYDHPSSSSSSPSSAASSITFLLFCTDWFCAAWIVGIVVGIVGITSDELLLGILFGSIDVDV